MPLSCCSGAGARWWRARRPLGAVVNVASIAGLAARGSSMDYGASKAGAVALTRHLARGLGPAIRVNAVAPGAVDSDWKIEWTEEQRRSSVGQAPMGRRCTTEDITEAIVFLGCGAAMVTGQVLVVEEWFRTGSHVRPG